MNYLASSLKSCQPSVSSIHLSFEDRHIRQARLHNNAQYLFGIYDGNTSFKQTNPALFAQESCPQLLILHCYRLDDIIAKDYRNVRNLSRAASAFQHRQYHSLIAFLGLPLPLLVRTGGASSGIAGWGDIEANWRS